MNEFSILYATFPNVELARKLAEDLLDKRMATLINLLPSVITIYREEQKNEIDAEVMLMAKIRTNLSADIIQYVGTKLSNDGELFTVPITRTDVQFKQTLDRELDQNLNII